MCCTRRTSGGLENKESPYMDASLRPGLLLLHSATWGVARAQSYGYSYSYSYSYGAGGGVSGGETPCTAVGDTRGGANCEDRWAVLYPAELTLSTGHSCHWKNVWGQCSTWYRHPHRTSHTFPAARASPVLTDHERVCCFRPCRQVLPLPPDVRPV